MKKRKTFLGLILVIAVLVLGVGYAALTSVNFTINGTASATADQENFKVIFDSLFEVGEDEEPILTIEDASVRTCDLVSSSIPRYPDNDDGYEIVPLVKISHDGEQNAKISVSGLRYAGETITIRLPVINQSNGVSAKITNVEVNSNTNTNYFGIEPSVENEIIASGEVTYVDVAVTLTKAVVEDDETAEFEVTFKANPIEPVEETD